MYSLTSQNPESVLERQQIREIKYKHGCAACSKRDLRAMAINALACSVPGNFPQPVFCYEWQYDEGFEHGNNTQAA